jgi:hypothetical protein
MVRDRQPRRIRSHLPLRRRIVRLARATIRRHAGERAHHRRPSCVCDFARDESLYRCEILSLEPTTFVTRPSLNNL